MISSTWSEQAEEILDIIMTQIPQAECVKIKRKARSAAIGWQQWDARWRRYKLDGSKPRYESATSVVWKAEDVLKDNEPVALKIMYDPAFLLKEIETRQHLSEGCVLEVISLIKIANMIPFVFYRQSASMCQTAAATCLLHLETYWVRTPSPLQILA